MVAVRWSAGALIALAGCGGGAPHAVSPSDVSPSGVSPSGVSPRDDAGADPVEDGPVERVATNDGHGQDDPGVGKVFRMPGSIPTDADRDLAMRSASLPDGAMEKIRSECFGESSSAAAWACRTLATFHAEGLFGVERDAAASQRLFDRATQHDLRACDAGVVASCATAGSFNAMKLRTLEPSSASAAEWAAATIPLLEKACRGGSKSSCADLADIYESGRGVGRDGVRATAYRVKSEP